MFFFQSPSKITNQMQTLALLLQTQVYPGYGENEIELTAVWILQIYLSVCPSVRLSIHLSFIPHVLYCTPVHSLLLP